MIQATKLPEHNKEDFVAIVTPDEARHYHGYPCVVVVYDMSLYAAIEIADQFILECDMDVIIDDINKFTCGRSCHMERNAVMKPFLMKMARLTNKLIMRTDEVSPSLDAMIDKIFPK